MERVKGFGPSTPCLGSRHSTAELHPPQPDYYSFPPRGCQSDWHPEGTYNREGPGGGGVILLTGGTGFVGRHVARELCSRGTRVRCLVRRTSNLQPLAGLPLEFAQGDVASPASLEPAVAGVEAAIHLVAVIRERGQATFERVNHQGTANLVRACRGAGVKRLLYLSNIGAGPDPAYPFLLSKWRGEEEIRASGIPYTIFRSSIMYGPGDEFVNKLARLIRMSPLVPIIGSGRTRLQPIAVADTARCLAQALEEGATLGRSIDLGGPEHLTYEEMVDAIISALGRRRLKVHVPVALMRPAVWALERLLPRPPLTRGQLKMLNIDNVTQPEAVERAFGFKPLPFRQGLGYLRR